jgi:S1-C subfamily serine protease
VERGWLGVQIEDITPELAEAFKLSSTTGPGNRRPRAVKDNKGRIKPGDVVRAIAGTPVHDAEALLRAITALTPGQRSDITVVREGKEVLLTVGVGRRPAPRTRR